MFSTYLRNWRNAFTKERDPESKEGDRNAFLIFGKDRDRNAAIKINARIPFAFLKRLTFNLRLKNPKEL